VFGVRTNQTSKFFAALAPLREKNYKISPRRKVRKGIWGKNKSNIKAHCGLCASARDKNNKLSQRRRARRVAWGKNNSNIEVLGGLGAFARKKTL
jgi:hypothetical protein